MSACDLEVALRSGNIQHLVLAGLSTSDVVLSTLPEAADRDYRLTVLSDLCADPDPEVHRVLLEKVFPRQSQVVTSEQWLRGLAVDHGAFGSAELDENSQRCGKKSLVRPPRRSNVQRRI